MATRFYTDPTNAPTVSPAFIGSWDDDTQAVRRKLVIDTPGNNGSTTFTVDETAAYNDRVCVVQFVSEPLDSISATLSADAAFLDVLSLMQRQIAISKVSGESVTLTVVTLLS